MKEKEKEKEQRDQEPVKVEDRRHWARGETEADESAEAPSTHPTLVDQLKKRADDAEKKLLEYISAFKQAQADQDRFRERLQADVDRKVELRFGSLVADVLESMDDLDLALSHVKGVQSAAPLAKGVELARERFLSALDRNGVERLDLEGSEFDPNLAEAVGVEPAGPDQDRKVVRTVRPGYRMGERVIRPARVIVGRRQS
jgi:molecular chaperone GrpE